VKVRYGVSELAQSGITENVSQGGVFVRTNDLHPRNTILRMDLTMPDQQIVSLIGKVRWTSRAPANAKRLGGMSGMGVQIVRFISGLGYYIAYCQSMGAD